MDLDSKDSLRELSRDDHNPKEISTSLLEKLVAGALLRSADALEEIRDTMKANPWLDPIMKDLNRDADEILNDLDDVGKPDKKLVSMGDVAKEILDKIERDPMMAPREMGFLHRQLRGLGLSTEGVKIVDQIINNLQRKNAKILNREEELTLRIDELIDQSNKIQDKRLEAEDVIQKRGARIEEIKQERNKAEDEVKVRIQEVLDVEKKYETENEEQRSKQAEAWSYVNERDKQLKALRSKNTKLKNKVKMLTEGLEAATKPKPTKKKAKK